MYGQLPKSRGSTTSRTTLVNMLRSSSPLSQQTNIVEDEKVGATWKCFEPGRYQEAFKANIEPMILEGTLNIGDIAEAISEVAGLFGKRMSKRAQLDDTINGLRNIRRTTFDLRGRRAISKQIWALQNTQQT